MKLYICGNGFDLHCKFNTAYTDYYNYLTKDRYSKSNQVAKSAKLCPYTNFPTEGKWSDVEQHLKFDYRRYIEDCASVCNRERCRTKLEEEDLHLWDEWKRNTFFLDYADMMAGNYLYEWICAAYQEGKSVFTMPDDMEYLLGNTCDYFITFNYTPTLEELFQIPVEHILHVHGSLQNIKREDIYKPWITSDGSSVTEIRQGVIRPKLQFGSDENDPLKVMDELSRYIKPVTKNDMFDWNQLKEQVCTVCRNTSKNVMGNMQTIRSFLGNHPVEEVIIIGHSFDGIDEIYYNKIFIPQFKDAKWRFYYRDSKDRALHFLEKYNLSISKDSCIKFDSE